ncbi:MAG: DUF262 domain-containing protein, partial [Synergistaceae bacterium]|nr:DUF262 domain-containing protein [Synergistaceae bacterium]
MKTDESGFVRILANNIQFILPKYQRHYSWEEKHCQRLWNDLVKMQKENRDGHFIGTIVSINEGGSPTGVQKFTLIDGQQRLATLTLILIALRDYLYFHLDDRSVKLSKVEDNLKDENEDGDDRYKLLLTGYDQKILIGLIDRTVTPEETDSRLITNYKFFTQKISEGELTPAEIYEAVGKLNLVSITLEHSDNAQAIFESLNSTGKDLSESDLIRNFVLMALDNKTQTEIYDKYWAPMEKLFGNDEQEKIMDGFFRDYLTMKLSRIPNENQVYDEFKTWYHQSSFENNIAELCKYLKKKAECYTNMFFKRSSNSVLQDLYSEIKEVKIDVAYPFLLKVHEDFENGLITEENLIEIMKLCVSFVIRRYICGIATAGTNNMFATLRNEINTENYMQSLKNKWSAMELSRNFPTDEKFRDAFISQDIYKLTARRFYILKKLEEFNNKEKIITSDSFTIEHVMPQNENLSLKWCNELGLNWREIQKKYLHTIGNLTLTAYNSELGDKPFSEKMKIYGGYLNSGLRLNEFIRNQTHWDEEKIKERAEILADKALKIWPYPHAEKIATTKQASKPQTSYSLESYKPSELTRDLFEKIDRRIKNLSDDIEIVFTKLYVAYKFAEANFAEVIVQKSKLKIFLNMKISE